MRNAFSFLLKRQTRRSSHRDHMCSDIFCFYLLRHSPRRSRYHSQMAQSAYKTIRRWRALLERPLVERLGYGEGCCLTYSCFLFSYRSFCSSYNSQKASAWDITRRPLQSNGRRVRDSIMITKIHNVSRVTSAGSSEELADSHVNKTTRLATEDSESPWEDWERAIQAPYQPLTIYPTWDIGSHSSTIAQKSASHQRSLRNSQKNRRRLQYISSSSETVMPK
jgi:hypothetical protein